MSPKRVTTGETFYTLFLMAESLVGGLTATAAVLHVARHFGATPLDAAVYAIVAAIACGTILLSQIMGTVVDSLHKRIDEVLSELQRSDRHRV